MRQRSRTGGERAVRAALFSGLALIALLVLAGQWVTQKQLDRQEADARVINMAGRQRTLGQRATKDVLVAQQPPDRSARERALLELRVAARELVRFHEGLRDGDPSLRLPGDNPPAVSRLLLLAEGHLEAMSEIYRRTLASGGVGPVDERQLLENDLAFFRVMDEVVLEYEMAASQKLAELRTLQWTIVAAILTLILLEAVFLVRPATNFIARQMGLLREERSQLLAMLEQVPDAVLILSPDGVVQRANREAVSLFGYTEQELTGQSLGMLLPEAWALTDGLTRRIGHGVEDPLAFAPGLDLLARTSDDSERPVDVKLTRIAGAEHGPDVLLAVVRDMSERRAAEERTKALQDDLNRVARLSTIGELAATIAHELNQPLASMSNYAEGCLARIRKGDAEMEELEAGLSKIRSASARAGEIVRRVRRFLGRSEPHWSLLELREAVDEALELLTPMARQAGVEVRVVASAQSGAVVADRLGVQQILVNLVRNAIEAERDAEPSPDGRVVRVHMDGDADGAWISVSDTGPGVDPEVREGLFEPFVTSKSEGLGMGLAISRSIAQAHGGRLEFTAGEGGGSVFRLWLPRDAAETA